MSILVHAFFQPSLRMAQAASSFNTTIQIDSAHGWSAIVKTQVPSNSSVSFVDVKIKLDGGPPELEKERSCRLKIDPKCAQPFLYDQYEDVSLKDEQQHLDRLGRYLTVEASGAVAYLVAYAGRTSCFREAERRANRARQYLEANYKLDASRVITIDGGFRDKLTVDIFTSAYDTCGPFPTPSLMSSSAHINGSCTDKYKEGVIK